MSYGFYGWQQADVRDRNGLTPRDLYDLLKTVWCAETCAPRMRAEWTRENPTLGQCSITAFLIQGLFGGQVFGVPLGDGNFHCYNAVDGCVFDLTSEQFGSKALSYDGNPEQFRETHFAKEEKRLRYELLRRRLLGEYAVSLKRRGHNCCQAVLCAYASETGLAPRTLRELGAGFGGGMGCMEATCGALCGAQMTLGLLRGEEARRRAGSLHRRFAALCGASICKELKGVGRGAPLCACDDCVRHAAEALEEALRGA